MLLKDSESLAERRSHSVYLCFATSILLIILSTCYGDVNGVCYGQNMRSESSTHCPCCQSTPSRRPRLSEAYQMLGLMISLGVSVSVKVWSILMDGFCGLLQPRIAGDLLKKMLETGCSPNVVTYTTLIKGFLDSRMVSSAFSILNVMESNGSAPDLILCNVLIDCLSKIGRYDDALDVYLSLSKRNLVPDSYTFSSLLSNIYLSRSFALLLKLGSGLLIEADLVVYNSLLSYFCKARLPSFALELYNDMLDRGFTPDKYSFAGLLCGLCEARRIDEAVNVYKGMIMNYPGLDAHIHTIIIDKLIGVGQCHKAIHLFRRALLEKFPLDVVSYTVAIRGLVKAGRMGEAYALYSQMKEVGIFPNAHTYDVIISGFCKERDIKVVKQLLQEISKERIVLKFSTLIRVTKLFLRLQPYSSAFNQLNEMWDLRYQSDEAIYTMLFDGFSNGIKVGETKYLSSDDYLEDNLFMGSSSSEDLSDVNASVG